MRSQRSVHFPMRRFVFIDCVPASHSGMQDPALLKNADIGRLSVEFPTLKAGAIRLVLRKAQMHADRLLFSIAGHVREGVFGNRVIGLTRVLREVRADAYIAHNIETLLPAIIASRGKAQVIFDCMEYYSDMGDSQSEQERRASRLLEARFLPHCSLVIASSESLADALAVEYGIPRPQHSYNVPLIARDLQRKRGDGLNLYWRNNVIGFGQRGLEDALLALRLLPSDVRLFLQGRHPIDGGNEIVARARSLGVSDRVSMLAPHAPHESARAASPYDVGLCLERKGPRNHDLTVSNKMFDYHMGGLAIISSNLTSLKHVIDRSRGGLLFEAGNPESLADAIRLLYGSPSLLAELQQNARRYALEEANLEIEINRLSDAFRQALGSHRRVTASAT